MFSSAFFSVSSVVFPLLLITLAAAISVARVTSSSNVSFILFSIIVF